VGFLKSPNIKISALTAFPQNNLSPYETATDGYTLVNLSVYAEIKLLKQSLGWGISANNIFDIQYFDHLSTLKPLNFYNQGRNIALSLEIPFEVK